MPAPNRARYSNDYAGGSSAVRTLGAFLLCAVLSFALGFFVLARFWSSKPKTDGDGLEKNMVATAAERSTTHHADDAPSPLRTALPAPQPTPHVVPPRIDAAQDEVQKPAAVDENKDKNREATRAADPSQDNLPDPSTESVKPGDAPADTPAPATETKLTKHKKRRASGETQASRTPDEEIAPPVSTDDVNDVHAPRRKRAAATDTGTGAGGLFRVQIGVYSTREKAEEQAKSASDKGFDSTVHTVTSGDRTLYRVQHSAHRSRTNAEMEKQRLVDAGFDAYISNP